MWVINRTDVLEELSASYIRVARIGELGTTLAVTSNRRMLRRSIMPFRTLHCVDLVRTDVSEKPL
jgi:hypothetical protein